MSIDVVVDSSKHHELTLILLDYDGRHARRSHSDALLFQLCPAQVLLAVRGEYLVESRGESSNFVEVDFRLRRGCGGGLSGALLAEGFECSDGDVVASGESAQVDFGCGDAAVPESVSDDVDVGAAG